MVSLQGSLYFRKCSSEPQSDAHLRLVSEPSTPVMLAGVAWLRIGCQQHVRLLVSFLPYHWAFLPMCPRRPPGLRAVLEGLIFSRSLDVLQRELNPSLLAWITPHCTSRFRI
jgi:hypothetical protein